MRRMDGKDRIHPRQAEHLFDRRRQAGKFKHPFGGQQLLDRDDGAKPAGIEELDPGEVKHDAPFGLLRQVAHLLFEQKRAGGIDSVGHHQDGNKFRTGLGLQLHGAFPCCCTRRLAAKR